MDHIPTVTSRRRRGMAPANFEDYSKAKFKLNNGAEMPAIGLGTYRIRYEADIMKAVDYALNAGYRMFDTAAVYRNETHLGKALKVLLPKYGLDREDIFITSKLSPADHGKFDIVEKAVMKSLNNLGLDYIDLYLMHFPGTMRVKAEDPRNRKLRLETWASLEDIYDDGKANAIGVSNFTLRHLKDLLLNRSTIPVVNQVEWHPYYHQNELLSYCKERDIVVQGYCSFGGQSISNSSLIEDPVVKNISKRLDVTPHQVLLVWSLQQDVAVIPKSINAERISQNISMNFKLTDEDMKALDLLGEKNIKYAWDPSLVA